MEAPDAEGGMTVREVEEELGSAARLDGCGKGRMLRGCSAKSGMMMARKLKPSPLATLRPN